MTKTLPKEINGESVDRLCLDTAQLFARYGIDFVKDEKLYLNLIETIGEFLEEKCQMAVVQKINKFS